MATKKTTKKTTKKATTGKITAKKKTTKKVVKKTTVKKQTEKAPIKPVVVKEEVEKPKPVIKKAPVEKINTDKKIIGKCKCLLSGKMGTYPIIKKNVNTVWILTNDKNSNRTRTVKRHKIRDKVVVL